jgi:hypothetical protein
LANDELGPAANCIWIHGQPEGCVSDPSRGTIDRDYYQELLDTIDTLNENEYQRRKI